MSLRKKRKTSSKSSILTIIERSITLTSTLKNQKESQKTSVDFGDLYASDYN